MYTITDVPAFREQILANVAISHKEGIGASILKGGSSRLEVVTHYSESGMFIASVVDISAATLIIRGEPEANPAMAMFKLFEKSSEGVTKALESQMPNRSKEGDSKHPTTEKA